MSKPQEKWLVQIYEWKEEPEYENYRCRPSTLGWFSSLEEAQKACEMDAPEYIHGIKPDYVWIYYDREYVGYVHKDGNAYGIRYDILRMGPSRKSHAAL